MIWIFQPWMCKWFTEVQWEHLQQLQTITCIHRFVLFTLFVWFRLDLLRSDRFVPSHCLLLLYSTSQFIFLCSFWNNSAVSHYMSIVDCIAVQKHWFSKKAATMMEDVNESVATHSGLFGLVLNSIYSNLISLFSLCLWQTDDFGDELYHFCLDHHWFTDLLLSSLIHWFTDIMFTAQ